jgi:hypothetical protein
LFAVPAAAAGEEWGEINSQACDAIELAFNKIPTAKDPRFTRHRYCWAKKSFCNREKWYSFLPGVVKHELIRSQ